MLSVIPIQGVMRDSLAGALATDPVLPDRRAGRRRARARAAAPALRAPHARPRSFAFETGYKSDMSGRTDR